MDGWHTVHDTETQDTTMGVYIADLPTERLLNGATIAFTFYWPETRQWERMDFTVTVN